MKKFLVILVIIATFFSFQSALKKYDDLLLNNFGAVDSADSQSFEFSISGELDVDATANFQKDFLRLLDKYELNCYQRMYMDGEYLLWAYTQDENYLNGIALTEGKLSSVRPGDYYFSNDGNKKGVIFNPIRNENYKIYHLNDFSSKHKSIFVLYELVAYEAETGAEAMPLYDGFTEDFKTLYPDLSVRAMLLDIHGGDTNKTINYENIIFAILTGLMVILGLNVVIVGQTKKIQILKLEGYSNLQIFRDKVLRYLGLILLVMLVINTGLYLAYMETDFENTIPFLMYLIAPNLIFVVSLFAFSAASFAAISMIDVNSAIKGKSSLKKQKYLNYAMKVSLIVFTTLIVLNGVDLLTQYFRTAVTESAYVKQIDRLYNGANIKHQYVGATENPAKFLKNHEEVQKYFKQNNNYFELMHLEQKSINNGKIKIVVADASKEYVEQYISQTTADRLEEGENYVLIPKGLENQKDLIYEALRRDYIGFDPRGLGDIVIYPGAKMNNVMPSDYIRYGMNVPKMVIVVTGGGFGSISNHSYFEYDGDPAEAQEYFDSVFSKFGAVSWVNVESVKEQYIFRKAFFLQGFYAMLPVFLMILLAIVTNTYQLAILNCEINDKRYAIMKSEGKGVSALISGEVKTSALLLLVAETILYMFPDIPFWTLIVVVGVYFVADVLLLRLTTGLRTRHFAEKLR